MTKDHFAKRESKILLTVSIFFTNLAIEWSLLFKEKSV